MTQEEELIALYDLLGAFLRLPARLRMQAAAWFAPEAVKPNAGPHRGNGLDYRLPRPAPPPPSSASPKSNQASIRRLAEKSRTKARAVEDKLIAAMADNPGLSVIALANAAGSSRSATGERLRQMALRGVVAKDTTGRWKLKEAEPGPQQPPSS